ncbi:MAG: hypothetical protein COV99_01045 [Bacteroidetes bacterium CG12_big_fil_rev_8_21_14_0_65_60_17]|nr:MAG: hypothetical protein COV99_01045 [Bacteroidetes bacterium CG12_big_fil_rev_8_21_14_0_65_60_17]
MLFTVLLLLLVTQPVITDNDEECFEDTFCIITQESDEGVVLTMRPLIVWDITLRVDMELTNLTPSRPLPLVLGLGGRLPQPLVDLRIKEPGKPWSFSFTFEWVTGRLHAQHARSVTYALPYSVGSRYMVGQSFHGNVSHQGKYAIDWNMPTGTPVLAARSGLVVATEDSYRQGGNDPALKTRANYVRIRHDDGTIGNYVHLSPEGVRVHVGERVREGELIGLSGNTGFSTGPHLHFEVYAITENLERKTIPVEFRTRGRSAQILQAGTSYGH